MIGNPRMNHLDKDAVRLIAAATSTEITIPEENEEINMCKAIEEMKIYYREEGRAEERAHMSKAFEEMKTQCREEGRAEGKTEGALVAARKMFRNGAVYDFVRACTDQVVSDQMLHEMEHSLQLENA